MLLENTARLSRRVALLLTVGAVGLCSASAVASSVKVECERSVRLNASLDVPVEELSVAIVDHVATASSLTPGDADLSPRRVPSATIDSPRVAAILEQIFEQQVGLSDQVPELLEPASIDITDEVPVIHDGLSGRKLQLPASEFTVTEPDPVDAERRNDDSPDISAQLPGFDEDESSRFRREMFRTDI